MSLHQEHDGLERQDALDVVGLDEIAGGLRLCLGEVDGDSEEKTHSTEKAVPGVNIIARSG